MEFGRRGTGQRAQRDRSGLAGGDFVSWDRYVNSSHREPSEVSRQESAKRVSPGCSVPGQRLWQVSRAELCFILRCAPGVPEAIGGLSEQLRPPQNLTSPRHPLED